MAKIIYTKKKGFGFGEWFEENLDEIVLGGVTVISVGVGMKLGYDLGKRVTANRAAELLRKEFPGIMYRYSGFGADAMMDAVKDAAPEIKKLDINEIYADAFDKFARIPEVKKDLDFCTLKKVRY